MKLRLRLRKIGVLVSMLLCMTSFVNGAQISSSYYTFITGYGVPFGVIRTLDGGMALFGTSYGMWVVKLDSTNAVQWSNTYELSSSASNRVYLVQLSDSSYVFNWNGPDTPLGGYVSGTNFTKLDKNGNVLFTQRHSSTSNTALVFSTDLRKIPGTDSIIYVESFNTSRSYIVKMASNGNGNLVRATVPATGYNFTTINPLVNGGVLQGYLATDDIGGLTKIDIGGNVVWTKRYTNGFKDIIQIGNYYFATSFNKIVKMDLNGNPVAAVQLPFSVNKVEASTNNTIYAVISSYQKTYKILEMDTTLSIIRAKTSSGNVTYYGDMEAYIHPATGIFYLLGTNVGTGLYGCEKASLDTSCTFFDTTIVTTPVTYTTLSQGASTTATYFLSSYTAIKTPYAVTSNTVCSITPVCNPPTASIVAGGPTTFCDTDSVLLSAQQGSGYTYQWQLNNVNIGGATGSDYTAKTGGSYTCIVANNCTSATSNAIVINVNITPAQPGLITSINQACNPVNSVPVSISAVPGATSYHWYAINPTITFNGPVDGLTASVNLLPSTNSGYNIWVEAINNGCVSQPRIKFIRRSLSVPAAVIGNAQVCVPQTGVGYSCAAVTGADDYLWTVPAGVTITSGQGTNAIVVSFAGNYTSGSVCVSARLNCGYATTPKCKTITSFSTSPVTITNLSGPTYLCPGTTYNYSVNNISGATFNWTVPANVSINSGQGTNAITISVGSGFSSGNVCVNASNSCATSATSCKGVATSAPARPTSISGVLNGVCASTQSYTSSTVTGATAYTWSVTGGSILSGQNTQTVNVQWNGTGATSSLNVAAVNGCGAGLIRSVGITLKPGVAAAISGPSALCAGSANNVFSIPAATGASTYTWQITPAGSTITSGQGTTSINALWGTSSGKVLCTPTNACGTSKTKTFAVTVNCKIGNEELNNETSTLELTAYPNPFNDKLNIQLNSSDDANAIIKISDMTGRVISELLIEANVAYTLGDNLSNGIYFVTAKQNDSVKTIRVVKNQ